MRKVAAVMVMIAVMVITGACSRDGAKSAGKGGQGVFHDKAAAPATTLQGMIGAVRNQKLMNYTTSTIGQAFDAYRHLEKKEWTETVSPDGKMSVDFIGWSKPGMLDAIFKKDDISARGLRVRFVINPDGAFYVSMISKIETRANGGKSEHSLEDQKRILDAIYANKKIS